MMREIKFLRRLPLCAAATAISALGLFGAAPAQAMPDFPLAPGDCPQWGFNGTTSFKQATGEDLVFESANQVAGGPSTWFYPNGSRDTGSITGSIDPNGQVNVSWYDPDSRVDFVGTVGSDGIARGTRPGSDAPVSWNSTTQMQCLQDVRAPGQPAAPKPGSCIPDPFNLNFPGAC